MILAIESSCDESAVALFEPVRGLVHQQVASQIALHQPFGGVVPDIASREHLKNFPHILTGLLGCAGVPDGLRRIAVTAGPGLAGSLALGVALAKALALAWELPLVGVNHLRGHAFSPFIDLHAAAPAGFEAALEALLPHLGLIVSGGNTLLVAIDRARSVRVVAGTVDDAAGEALDKGAKLLGMPYPGGPLIEKLAQGGDPRAFDFPRAFAHTREPRFSFSGLKTSLRYLLEKLSDAELERRLPDVCASYQAAVVDALVLKAGHVLVDFGPFRSIGLSGGVANNQTLRAAIADLADRHGMPSLHARREHTGDNAAMIAFAAWIDPRGCRDNGSDFALSFDPSWHIDA